jgi:hypothetical protein
MYRSFLVCVIYKYFPVCFTAVQKYLEWLPTVYPPSPYTSLRQLITHIAILISFWHSHMPLPSCMHFTIPTCSTYRTLIKKKIKFFSYTRKFRGERLQSRLTAPSNMTNMTKYLRISSYIRKPFLILYMALQPLPSEFPLIFFFISVPWLFYTCSVIFCPYWFLSFSALVPHECRILIQKCLKLVPKIRSPPIHLYPSTVPGQGTSSNLS